MAYYTNPTNYTYGYYPPVYQPMAILLLMEMDILVTKAKK